MQASVLQEHTYTFEDVARGTRVAIAMEAEPGGFFRIAGPRLEKAAHRQAKNELQKLQEVVQARGWPVVKQ